MRVEVPHDWPRDEAAAVRIQDELRARVDLAGPGPSRPRTIAGLDVAYGPAADGGPGRGGPAAGGPAGEGAAGDGPAGDGAHHDGAHGDGRPGVGTGAGAGAGAGARERVAAAVVVMDADTHRTVATSTAVGEAVFPYIPGLFAFRELPTLVTALRGLDVVPDLLLCDGQGLAHPRRFGLACHLGVVTGLPTAGVAKNPFVGTHTGLGQNRGDWAPLLDGGETVGRALRTQKGVKPVYVSTGHGIDLDTACRHVLAAAPRYRLPETTRLADRLCRDALREGPAVRGHA
jgi:deoxyribonuclease V